MNVDQQIAAQAVEAEFDSTFAQLRPGCGDPFKVYAKRKQDLLTATAGLVAMLSKVAAAQKAEREAYHFMLFPHESPDKARVEAWLEEQRRQAGLDLGPALRMVAAVWPVEDSYKR